MAEDSEKRFNSIMNKLFQSPKSTPESTPTSSIANDSPSDAQLSRGKKQVHISTALGSKEPIAKLEVAKRLKPSFASTGCSDVPMCRPWDRADLVKRLGTFKSMLWFAKPKVVSAVNCARRGWINVDTDMIACESCGAQLIFSTPSSWSQQQVEKAALVFSLKLENGHKLLCPWIENACDETLAEFPPTPTPALVDKFRERCSMLVRVFVLPVVSSSAIEHMRSPQLEQYLENSSVLEFGDGSTDNSEAEYLRKEDDTKSAKLYYQALKLISLCGWEPRSLPYVVDSKDGSNHTVKTVNTEGVVKTSCILQPNLGSVVLDCKLCGASVGLWTFQTVVKPLEMFRLNGPTNEGIENGRGVCDLVNEDRVENMRDAEDSVSNRLPSLNTTIAGGPPPTRQNFTATISLPIASRNLGDWLLAGMDSDKSTLSGLMAPPAEDEPRACSDGEIAVEKQFLQLETNSCESFCEAKKSSIQSDENVLQDFTQNDELYKSAENGGIKDFTELEPSSSQILEKDNQISQVIISSPYDDCMTPDKTALPEQGTIQEGCGAKEKMQISSDSREKLVKQASSDKAMEFDPIKQHRYFCPWIASANNVASGWQQTLSAILRKKDFSLSPPNDFPSSSIIKVDDPVMSVRKLFTLSAKKLKHSLASNKTTKP